jgi:hypothetical protein
MTSTRIEDLQGDTLAVDRGPRLVLVESARAWDQKRRPMAPPVFGTFHCLFFLEQGNEAGTRSLLALELPGSNAEVAVAARRDVLRATTREWEDFIEEAASDFDEPPHLVVDDGSPELRSALGEVLPGVRRHTSWGRKLLKVLSRVPKSEEAACLADAWLIPTAEDIEEALLAYWNWASQWRAVSPEAVLILEEDLRALLAAHRTPEHVRDLLLDVSIYDYLQRL